jgi:4-amino-4-deoxy-L-arabinose transferase-like glycosyltransferase
MSVGLFGREPYKPDEAYTVGLVKAIVDTGDWVVPRLVGEPFMEKPPLFYVVAAVFAKALPWLPLHEAARLAVVLFVALALVAIAASGHAGHGDNSGRLALLLTLATVGGVVRLHQLITDTAQFAGVAIALLGLVRARARPALGGVLLGTGLGITFLSKGLLGPGLIVCTSLALLAFPTWRQRSMLRSYALAALIGAAAAGCWLVPLALRAPDQLSIWFFDNNLGRFFDLNGLGPKKDLWFYLRVLPWYALPCWPLILWGLVHRSGAATVHGHSRGDLPPLVFIAVTLTVLTLASDGRELYALLLVPALAMAATHGLVKLRVQTEQAWAFGVAGLLLLASALVLSVWALAMHSPELTARLPPAAALPAMIAPRAGALAAYAVVVVAVMMMWSTLRRPIRGTLPLAGASGLALLWATLTLPWGAYLDQLKGYRTLALDLRTHLPQANCMASQGLGEGERALLEYYIGVRTERTETAPSANRCDLLLVQKLTSAKTSLPAPWELHWQGGRGDAAFDTSTLNLYVRRSATH